MVYFAGLLCLALARRLLTKTTYIGIFYHSLVHSHIIYSGAADALVIHGAGATTAPMVLTVYRGMLQIQRQKSSVT